jgi:hypothetical protein
VRHFGIWGCATLLLLSTSAFAQQQPTANAAALSPEQQSAFAAARQDFGAQRWQDALVRLRALHDQQPQNAEVAKFAAEASLNANDSAYAISLLRPIETSVPDDWQALALLARSYAESRRASERDAELDKLVALHKITNDPRLAHLTQFMVERITTTNGHIDLYYSLEPWSRYKIYEMGRVYNTSGRQVYRVTLESSDFDQPLWAKQHPKEAAAGMRMFSMDGYSEPIPGPNGTATQTHATYGFFDGRPSYDTIRDKMIAVANGKGRAISSTSGIPMPKQ